MRQTRSKYAACSRFTALDSCRARRSSQTKNADNSLRVHLYICTYICIHTHTYTSKFMFLYTLALCCCTRGSDMIRTPGLDSEAQHPVTCMLARAAGLLLWDCLFFPTSLCGVLTFGLSRSSSSSFSSSSSSSSPPPPLLLLCHPHGNPRHTRHTHCQHHALILMGTHHRTHYCHSLSLTHTTHCTHTLLSFVVTHLHHTHPEDH